MRQPALPVSRNEVLRDNSNVRHSKKIMRQEALRQQARDSRKKTVIEF